MKTFLVIIGVAMHMFLSAQTDSTKQPAMTLNAYAEVYYSRNLNKFSENNKPAFIYSHNRNNEFNLNLGLIKASYTMHGMRANLALAAGTYINTNYAAEPGVFKNVYEANIGMKLLKNKSLWFDAGIFSSHIGFESAISKDCWAVTRSILAENSPYYEAGAKLTYNTGNEKWMMSVLLLNGWQRIYRLDRNSLMSWGTQVQFKPSQKVLLNYSTFIGTDKPDSTRTIRTFHNIYAVFGLSDKLGLTLGFDIGTEENATGKGANAWYSPVGILKYSITNQWSATARAEYYNDKYGVIISMAMPYKVSGYSVNVDYTPWNNIVLRAEARNLYSSTAIFLNENSSRKNYSFITFSIASSF